MLSENQIEQKNCSQSIVKLLLRGPSTTFSRFTSVDRQGAMSLVCVDKRTEINTNLGIATDSVVRT